MEELKTHQPSMTIDEQVDVDISTMGFPDDWIDYLKV